MDARKPSKNESRIWSIPGRKERHERLRRLAQPDHHDRLIEAVGDLSQGGHIGGRFEIKGPIGEGGMSVVYRAWDHHRANMVALKCISPSLLQDPVAIQKFIQEAKIASRLSHPGIVKVFDVHQDQGIYFLEMELLEGGTLRDWTKRQQDAGKVPSFSKVNQIMQSICSALAYAHATTAHRDIKPENIALLPSGETKLMDFGLAQVLRAPHSSLFRESVNQLSAGTPYYMAPELLTPHGETDARVDQYSLAVIVYELLTGDLPLGVASSLFEKRPDLPLKFTAAVDRALNHRPEKRFEDIQTFAGALEHGARSEGVMDGVRRRWRSASSLTKAGMVTLLCMGLSLPASLMVQAHLRERASQVQQWHLRSMKAQKAMDLVREHLQILGMEENVLRRKMEVEGMVFAGDPAVSPSWMSVSNQWHAVHEACRWLQPKLNTNGNLALLDDLLNKARQAMGREQFENAGVFLNRFDEELAIATARSEKVREIFQLHHAIQRLDLSSDGGNTSSRVELSVTPSFMDLEDQHQWEKEYAALKHRVMQQRYEIERTFEESKHGYEAARLDWEELFPSDIGAPDMRFLIDVAAIHKRAEDLFQAEQFSRALEMLNQARQIYRRWTDDVIACRERTEAVWQRSTPRVEAMGMRFVWINQVYWSVWELRWMDFARWLSDNREIESMVMRQIDIDPNRIHPTQPVTGLDHRTANAISVWFGHRMERLARPVSALPTRQHWQALWDSEDLKGNYQFGMVPEKSPQRVMVLKDYYLDTEIQPENYLKPVASGDASPHGLYDLESNAWEWSASDLILKPHESFNQDPLKWMLHGGGYFGQHRFNQFEPPRENAVFITRPEAIGIRIILKRNDSLDKAAK